MRKLIILAAALGLAACAHEGATSGPATGGQAANDPAKTFDMSIAGSGGVTVTCESASCTGPQVQLQRLPDGWRGTWANRPVEFTTTETGAEGAVGSLPLRLTVAPQGDGLSIGGMFAGSLGDLRVDSREIQGRIGRCSYDLRASGASYYEGHRSCGGMPSATRVHLPTNLAERTPGERAAILALLLAS